jgi:glycosyltransferase involved in cell wall biosynthesis
MINHTNTGISVIICCYNSSARIYAALQALAKQKVRQDVSWEVVLVDNASTDNTAAIARNMWETLGTDIDFKITYEAAAGLANARKKGIAESTYSYIIFCDDDNWLYPDYLQTAFNILHSDKTIGACGGIGLPVFETTKPVWFDKYAEAFATGSQEINNENGKLLNLYGAGIAVRRSSIDKLEQAKFNPLMQGRKGKSLSSSEDFELTYALVLMGDQLLFSNHLKFYHYLPKERLHLSYLKKLFIAFGNDGPVRNLYYANISERPFHQKIKSWNFHLMLSLFRLVKYIVVPPKKGGRSIYFNWSLAYIKSLFALKNRYAQIKHDILRIKNYRAPIAQNKNVVA